MFWASCMAVFGVAGLNAPDGVQSVSGDGRASLGPLRFGATYLPLSVNGLSDDELVDWQERLGKSDLARATWQERLGKSDLARAT